MRFIVAGTSGLIAATASVSFFGFVSTSCYVVTHFPIRVWSNAARRHTASPCFEEPYALVRARTGLWEPRLVTAAAHLVG